MYTIYNIFKSVLRYCLERYLPNNARIWEYQIRYLSDNIAHPWLWSSSKTLMTMKKWWRLQGHEPCPLLAPVFRCFSQIEPCWVLKVVGPGWVLNILPSVFTWWCYSNEFSVPIAWQAWKRAVSPRPRWPAQEIRTARQRGNSDESSQNTVRKNLVRITVRNNLFRLWGKKWLSMCLAPRTFRQFTGGNTV